MNDLIRRKRKADFGSLIENIEKRSKKETTLETIEELIKLHKEYIKSGLNSSELEIGLLSLIAEQVQEKEGLLLNFAVDKKDFKRFALALTEHISNLKAADKPDSQITLEQYKESKLHQSLTDGIHHYYGKLYIACNQNTQGSQQKANELLVSESKLTEINKYLIMLQDISSLNKVSSYIELALSKSGRSSEEEILVIKKTILVIGECLKDLGKIPSLSSKTSEALSDNGIPISDLAGLRNAMSHSSELFTLPEMGEDDKKGLMEGFKSIKSIIDKNISKIEHEFVKDLANEAKNAYKGENEAIKGKLEEIANTTNFDEISQLTKEISEIVGSDHDNKKVKALLYDIRANIARMKTESSFTLELDSIFRVPENPGVDKLFGEITRKRVPIDESYEKLYTKLLEDLDLQDVNKSDLHKKLEEAQNGIRARYQLISYFNGKFDLSEELFEDCLNRMLDTHKMGKSSIKKLKQLVKAEPSENELIKLLKRDSYFKFMTQSSDIDKVLQGTFSKLLSRLKIAGLDRNRIESGLEKIPYQDIEILNEGKRLDFVLGRLKAYLDDGLYKKVYDAFYEKDGIVEGYKNREKLIDFFKRQDGSIASEEYELLVKSLRVSEKETENLLSYSTHWRNAQCASLIEKTQLTRLEQLYRPQLWIRKE